MSPSADPLAVRLEGLPTWRVIALGAVTVATALFAIVLLTAVAGATAADSPLPPRLHEAAVGLPVVVGLYAAGRRFVLRAPAGWFLAGRPDRRVLAWAGIGIALPAVALGVQLWAFDASVTGRRPPVDAAVTFVLASLAVGLLAGVLEELAFRGALLRLLEARWGPRTALWGTAAVFALLHQGHAGNRVVLVLVGASMLAAGLLLGLVVLRTRSVWNAVVVHAGWNAVFGGQVVTAAPPGTTLEAAVLQFRLHEPTPLLAGGGATLGASPLTTVLLLVAAFAVARWPARPGARSAPTETPPAREGR